MRARDRRDGPPVAARESFAPGWRRAIAISVLSGIALLAAACSGGGSSGTASVAASPSSGIYQQYLAYSRCMRTHGAPFWPGPSTRGGGYEYPITAHILAQEHGPSWSAAQSACAKLAPPQLPFTEAQLAAARSKLLKDIGCIRAHGFPGWPDPVITPNDIYFLPPRRVNMSSPSPRLRAAEQACHWPPAP
jgi:hypothetical protein